ncbi:MAG: pyridoxamine 5'-phosphate oxidase family protein [Bacillota bacterium]|nr:pyridoxamine 5'-phosphate oxidase family protein [Bacillota bacterium]
MNSKEAACKALELVESCGIAMVGSQGEDGYPNIKAMLKAEAEGIKTIWFSTNTSSKRVAQFKESTKACVYFVDQQEFKGLMLTGEMEVLNDIESRKRLWSDGCEIYYPLGVEDPDYSVLRFTAKSGNYYHGLQNVSFEI